MTDSTCVVFSPPGKVELVSVTLPEVSAGKVLVETLFSGVSPGTESRCLRGEQVGVGTNQCIAGYQAVGRVLKAGPGVDRSAGELVFFSQAESVPGFINFNGCHTQRAVVQDSKLHSLPEDAILAEAALGKICAVALHGIECARLQPGESVIVVGLGLLGQLSARIAKSRRAQVVALDRQPGRVEVARAAGIAAHISGAKLSESLGVDRDGFDVIIDATGAVPLISQCVELARDLQPWEAPTRQGSRYIIQGSYAGEFRFDYTSAFMKELNIIVPRDHTDADLAAALEMIYQLELPLADIVGEPVSPELAPEIYADLGSPEATRLTAVFDWSRL